MEQHGRLTLLAILPERAADKHKLAEWRCECGATARIPLSRVRNGYTRSCGCLMAETRRTVGIKHGMRGTPEYRSWTAMLGRCRNTNHKDYPRWGGRGITVCDEWAASFEAFFAHTGPRPAGTTLDRIDGSRGYEPGNVRWATPAEQALNRSDVVFINTPTGRMPLVEYAEKIGISKGAAHLRMKRGKLEGCTYA